MVYTNLSLFGDKKVDTFRYMIVPTKTISSNNQHSTSLREKGSMDKIIGFHLGIWDSLSPKIGRDPNQVSTWWGALLAEREALSLELS